MFLTVSKLGARIQELSNYRYRDQQDIIEFNQTEDAGKIGEYPPGHENYESVMRIGDSWSGRDRYLWLSRQVQLPANWAGRKVLGLFNFGRTGGGNNSGFESLLFLNGRPYQGVDSNHQEVFFPAGLIGQSIQLDFRLWSGLEGGGKPKEQQLTFETAMLAWLDEAADDLYYTSLAAWQMISELQDDRPEKYAITSALNEAFRLVNWSSPGSDEFYGSCEAARNILKDQLEKIGKHHPVTIHCVGHTHIDVAWLWRLKHTREKAARSFSTVLRLMEQFPEYYFLQTQPQLYEYIKEDYPEIYESIKQKVNEGLWEPEGGMWLEADCNIPSGESLVRQLLYGKQFLKNEFGIDCHYLWLPDVFGYSWALPQILIKSGIKTFMTTKISWNQYNRMPHDTFKWKGMDGSEILTHFITTPETYQEEDSWFYTYNGEITAKTILGSWQGYRDKNINQDLLLSYGYGDGGGGVNREMLELRRRFEKMPGLPHVKTARAGDFFNQLHERVNNTAEYVHTWDGELYLEYHRGTYTSQAYNKRMNRKLELGLREAEWLSVWAALTNCWECYPKLELYDGWKIVLRNQFHDIIPGSSIHEVYEDAKEEYAQAEQLKAQVNEHSIQSLLENNAFTYSIFNASQWCEGQHVHIPFDLNNKVEGHWIDKEGNNLLSQRTDKGWIIQLNELHSFGVSEIEFRKGENPSVSPFQLNANSAETPFYKIEWNEKHQLTSIFDKTFKREVLQSNRKANVLQVFEDKPLRYEAWDIDLFYQEKMEEVTEVVSSEVVEHGSVRLVIKTIWKYRTSIFEQEMILYAENRRIDFQTTIEWHEQQKLVKVSFPVDIRATEATYDIQYGNVKRPTHWNTSWDMARFETVGHQWADLSETGYGVSLLNDCKYGYDIKSNVLRLTLLKSATYPDPTADQGKHTFTYSLLPHLGDWRIGETVKNAWYLNHPLQAANGKLATDSYSFLTLENNHTHIDAIKKKEDENAVIIRLHEFEGRRGSVSLQFQYPVKRWAETNLMEEPATSETTNPIQFEIKPYEIKTLVVNFDNIG